LTSVIVQNPFSGLLERLDIGGLTPDELQALPLDERMCEQVAAAVAPCLPEEFLAAYVVRAGVVEAGKAIVGAWLRDRTREMLGSPPGGSVTQS
jgi:hypothetical protein